MIDITNQRFGRLVALRPESQYESGLYKWLCQCDCGKTKTICGSNLRLGKTLSCGCLHREIITKHDMWGSQEHNSWHSMLSRCTNTNDAKYNLYGGRGISVCDEWKDFSNFYRDMGNAPEGFTIDRIDCNGNYCKENCRWADYTLQNFNRRKTSRNTSGRTGVCWDKRTNSWSVTISKHKKSKFIGRFDKFEDAVLARESAEIEFYGFIKKD